jgi:ligand-binding sensor domain-containing protein
LFSPAGVAKRDLYEIGVLGHLVGETYYISEIAIDDNDNIWVTGLNPRLAVFDMNKRWVRDESDDVSFCRVMEKAPNGDMWLGTSEGIKVYRYCQTK